MAMQEAVINSSSPVSTCRCILRRAPYVQLAGGRAPQLSVSGRRGWVFRDGGPGVGGGVSVERCRQERMGWVGMKKMGGWVSVEGMKKMGGWVGVEGMKKMGGWVGGWVFGLVWVSVQEQTWPLLGPATPRHATPRHATPRHSLTTSAPSRYGASPDAEVPLVLCLCECLPTLDIQHVTTDGFVGRESLRPLQEALCSSLGNRRPEPPRNPPATSHQPPALKVHLAG
ncbi:hypothetical protein E2C01_028185 [Portunus trituberculatus]|uniref:Uncharacterized protein n=1 Tax=Portunus trituberculatus TaxID=210409 RepID=A0A5B7EPC2_PORTR|nr:hypothetical protein [Portunus trituberculatus]